MCVNSAEFWIGLTEPFGELTNIALEEIARASEILQNSH